MSPSAALAVIRRALPGATEAEQHFMWAQTGLETSWGDGWLDNSLGLAAHNWGADQGQPGFTYTDHHADGSEYVGTYRIYPSDEAGIQGAARIALKPNVREAVRRGDAYTAIERMRANGYFEAPADAYRAAVGRVYDSALSATGERRLLRFDEPSSGVSSGLAGGLVLFAFAAGAAALWFGSSTTKG